VKGKNKEATTKRRRMDSRGKQKNPLHLNGSKEGILDLLLRFTQSHSTHAQYRERETTIELHRSHHSFHLLLLFLLTPTPTPPLVS
jgi:hypothetical protein